MDTKKLEDLLYGAFEITMNLNDTFFYAAADADTISGDDLKDLMPIIEKYDYNAITAYFALKRGFDPEVQQNLNESFFKAKNEILAAINFQDIFEGKFFGLIEYVEDGVGSKKLDPKAFYIDDPKYSSLEKAFEAEGIVVGSIIGNDKTDYKVKVLAIGPNSAIVKEYESRGELIKNGREWLLNYSHFLRWRNSK